MSNYDLIVLGSGPGGYVAAIRAAQLGLKVAIVERENLGGICLNWGCIPTKALLRSAEVFHNMKHAAAYGLAADNIRADLDAVVKRSRGVAKQLNQGIAHLMKKNKITVHMGTGRLTAPGKLEVQRRRCRRLGQPKRSLPSTSSSPPARGRGTCRLHRLTASGSGPTATP